MLSTPALLVVEALAAKGRVGVVGGDPYYHVAVVAGGRKGLTCGSLVSELVRWAVEGPQGGGHTFGGPSNHVDSLGVLLESCEVLDPAVLSMSLDLPQLGRVRRRSVCSSMHIREKEDEAAYSNIGVSGGGG